MTSIEKVESVEFLIELNPEGDGGAYRIRNESGQINRTNIIDRGSSLVIQADLVEATHGRTVDKENPNGVPATLIITDFWLLPGKKSRRFTWAKITYRFDSYEAGSKGPTVSSIAPLGQYSLQPCEIQVEQANDVNLSLGTAVGPVNPNLSLGWDLKKSYSTKDQATIAGTIRLTGRDSGPKNTASWIMKENGTTREGIPSRLRTAILLKRRHFETAIKFQASVTVEIDADLKSKTGLAVARLLGRIPKDDPIIFDPQIPIGSSGRAVETLGEGNLQDLCFIETATKLHGDGMLAVATKQ